MKNHKFEYALL